MKNIFWPSIKTYLTIQHFFRSARRSFASLPETTLKSPFLCVNKSPSRYGFRAGARAFLYSVVIALDECFEDDRERTKREARTEIPTPSSFCLLRRPKANHRGLFVNA